MDTNFEFIRQCEEIMDFIDAYRMIRLEHINKIFPHSSKNIKYLVKNQRIYKSPDGAYISTETTNPPDKNLIAAVGVLTDIFDKVKYHAKASKPIQISFITHLGDYYEIIYVSYGMEMMVVATLEAQQSAGVQGGEFKDVAKRIVIIEDKKQIDRLTIPRTMRFALVSPDGGFIYFRGS